VLVVVHLHVNPNHLTNNNGQPVYLTVYARDPGLWLANFTGIGTAVVVSAVELAERWHRKNTRYGLIATILGGLLCAYSLFGLLYGVAAIAPIGVMLILSGVAIRKQPAAVGAHAYLDSLAR
jgi:hypothetical protein